MEDYFLTRQFLAQPLLSPQFLTTVSHSSSMFGKCGPFFWGVRTLIWAPGRRGLRERGIDSLIISPQISHAVWPRPGELEQQTRCFYCSTPPSLPPAFDGQRPQPYPVEIGKLSKGPFSHQATPEIWKLLEQATPDIWKLLEQAAPEIGKLLERASCLELSLFRIFRTLKYLRGTASACTSTVLQPVGP